MRHKLQTSLRMAACCCAPGEACRCPPNFAPGAFSSTAAVFLWLVLEDDREEDEVGGDERVFMALAQRVIGLQITEGGAEGGFRWPGEGSSQTLDAQLALLRNINGALGVARRQRKALGEEKAERAEQAGPPSPPGAPTADASVAQLVHLRDRILHELTETVDPHCGYGERRLPRREGSTAAFFCPGKAEQGAFFRGGVHAAQCGCRACRVPLGGADAGRNAGCSVCGLGALRAAGGKLFRCSRCRGPRWCRGGARG